MFTDLDIPDKPDASTPRAPIAVPVLSLATARLRDRIARIERTHARVHAAKFIAFGVPAIDAALPGGGLALNALHEAASVGPDAEHAAAAILFVAGLLAKLEGPVLWVLRQADLFAPSLADAGLLPARVVFAEAGKNVLPVMEEGLRHPGLAAVVAELSGRLSVEATRRLQQAAEQADVLAILIRRSQTSDDPLLNQPSAAATRWRIAALPSPPVGPKRRPGLWRLDLIRCHITEPCSWNVQACDAKGRISLVADPANLSNQSRRRPAPAKGVNPI